MVERRNAGYGPQILKRMCIPGSIPDSTTKRESAKEAQLYLLGCARPDHKEKQVIRGFDSLSHGKQHLVAINELCNQLRNGSNNQI